MDYGEVLRGLAVGGWGVEVYDRGGGSGGERWIGVERIESMIEGYEDTEDIEKETCWSYTLVELRVGHRVLVLL